MRIDIWTTAPGRTLYTTYTVVLSCPALCPSVILGCPYLSDVSGCVCPVEKKAFVR